MIWLKAAGSILILGSTSLIGHYYSSRGAKRAEELGEMKRALTILKEEVRFALSTFGEAALSIAERVLPPAKEIFEYAGQEALNKNASKVFSIWEDAVKNAENTFFTKEDISALISLGKNLGYLDKDMQIKSIDLLLEYIETTINKINDKKEVEARMFKSLGVLTGLLIIVVML